MNTSVCICILTYKRGPLLKHALSSLANLRFAKNSDIDLQLVVIDNDASGSGEAIYRSVESLFPYPTRYVVESEQGIANARNRALMEGGHADFIALVDDDETVDPFWIDELIAAQRSYAADVVTGPVTPVFEDAPAWVVQGEFFASRREKTGAIVHFVETNNVLIIKRFVNDFRFDLRFNKTSGEDTHFFLRLEQAGAKMVWAAEAKVSEFVPRQRTTAAWLIDRAQSDANRYTRAMLYLSPGLRTRCERLVKAIGALGAGSLILCSGITGRHRAVAGLRKMSRFVGTTKAVLGSSHIYYSPGQPLR